MTAFEEFGVLPEISKAIEDLGWSFPTDIQTEAIPLILGGGDVLLAAETGSGKTAAFSLPIVQIVWETLKDIQSGKTSKTDSIPVPIKLDDSLPWTMSTQDRGKAIAVASDGLLVQSREQKEWNGVRCTRGVILDRRYMLGYICGKGMTGGKWGFEATVTDEGLCRVGWSTLKATLELGTDETGWGFGGTGKKAFNKQFENYGEPFGKDDVVTCLLDFLKREIKFLKNGVDQGVAFTEVTIKEPLFPAVVLKNAEMAFNFGEKPFKYSLPENFLPLVSVPEDKLIINTNAMGVADGEIKLANNAPQAIIIVPSRELAEQTSNQIKLFKKYLKDPPIRELLVTGGDDTKEQISKLKNRGADIIIGSPGRIESLVHGGHLSLSNCRFFILDEADGLLKQNFGDFIEKLHGKMPKITADGKRLQMIVCSATLHSEKVREMAEKLMHFPRWVDLKGEDSVPDAVHHVVVKVDPEKDRSWENLKRHVKTDKVHRDDKIEKDKNSRETLSEAVKLLKGEYVLGAIDSHNMEKCIIFCRTKLDCDNLEKYFKLIDERKYSCVCLHGDRNHERRANLEKFKKNEVKFLICTGVAARGLDIRGLPYMINMTLPEDEANYVHRIGRVGRAEKMGLAISLVSTVPEKVWYHGDWCKTHRKNCSNSNLTDVGGCAMWYDELQLLGNIEDHLVITIQQIQPDFKVPESEFDGKVIYGQKRQKKSSIYQYHTAEMAPIVESLTTMEKQLQILYLNRFMTKTT